MLPRVHRIVDGNELRRVSRRGVRHTTKFFVASVVETRGSPTRVGFIVSKHVGGAVVRNRVKRRLRDLAFRSVVVSPEGRDIVVRALAPAGEASFAELAEAWNSALIP